MLKIGKMPKINTTLFYVLLVLLILFIIIQFCVMYYTYKNTEIINKIEKFESQLKEMNQKNYTLDEQEINEILNEYKNIYQIKKSL